MGNSEFNDTFDYYFGASQGPIPLDSFAEPLLRGAGPFAGRSASVVCNGRWQGKRPERQGPVFIWLPSLYIIRYNGVRREWQALHIT